MPISNALLKPQILSLKDQYEDLKQKLDFSHSPEETEKLKCYIEKELSEIHSLMGTVDEMSQSAALAAAPQALFSTYKSLRSDFRVAKRTWERLGLNKERFVRFLKKEEYAS